MGYTNWALDLGIPGPPILAAGTLGTACTCGGVAGCSVGEGVSRAPWQRANMGLLGEDLHGGCPSAQ